MPAPRPPTDPAASPQSTAEAVAILVALERSDSLPDLATALEQSGWEPAGDRPWRALVDHLCQTRRVWGLSWLGRRVRSPDTQTLLDALRDGSTRRQLVGAYHGTESHLCAALKQLLLPVLEDEFRDALLRGAASRLAGRGPRLASDAGSEAWRAWLGGFGFHALLDVPVGHILRSHLQEATQRWLAVRSDWSPARVLDARVYTGTRAWSRSAQTVPQDVRDDVVQALTLALVHDELAASAAPPPPPLALERWPKLGAAALDARAQLADLEAQFGREWTLEAALGGFHVSLDPPQVGWEERVQGWGRPAWTADVRLDPRVALLPPDDVPLPHWVRRAILRQLVDLLTPSQVSRNRLGDLERDLSLRPVDRLLADLVPPPAAELPLVGWGLREDREGRWLTPLWCEPKASGGLKTRLIKANELGVLVRSLDDPADSAALLALLGHDVERMDPSEGSLRRRLHEPAAVASALSFLTQHPRLYLQIGPERSLRLRREELQLEVSRREDGRIHLQPRLSGRPLSPAEVRILTSHRWFAVPALLVDEEAGTATLVPLPPRQRQILLALARHGESYDAEAEADLVASLPRLQEDLPLELDAALAGTRVDGDERLIVRLELVATGVAVAVWVRPMQGAAVQVPGRGVAACYGQRGAERVHALRDLARERRLLQDLARDLSLPEPDPDGRPIWVVDDGEAAASVLAALRGRTDVVVEWQGPTGRVRTSGGIDQLKIRFKPLGAWFALEGDLSVDEQDVDI